MYSSILNPISHVLNLMMKKKMWNMLQGVTSVESGINSLLQAKNSKNKHLFPLSIDTFTVQIIEKKNEESFQSDICMIVLNGGMIFFYILTQFMRLFPAALPVGLSIGVTRRTGTACRLIRS